MSGLTSNRKRENIGNLLIVLSVAGAFNKPLKSFTFFLWFYATALDMGHQLIFINRYEYFLEMPQTLAGWDFSVHPLKPTFNSPCIVQEPGDLIHDDSIIFQMPGRARGPRKPSLLWSPRLSVLLLLNWILWSPKAVLCVSSLCWCCPRRCTFLSAPCVGQFRAEERPSGMRVLIESIFQIFMCRDRRADHSLIK